MEAAILDNLLRSLAGAPSRRGIARAVAGLALAGPLSTLFDLKDAAAKKKRKRKKKCAKAGQTSKKKKRCCRGLVEDLTGRCARPCTPTSCPATSLCIDRICQPCDVCQPSGACAYDTLRAAIDVISNLTTIRICPGVYVGDVYIPRSLTLIGAGDGVSDGADTILERAGTDSVVVVDAEIEVALRRLRIRGSEGSSNGGGIRNHGDLTLSDCTISGNSASYGGGIYSDSSLTLTRSNVIGNTSSTAGGGIYSFRGTVILDVDSLVALNEANPNDPNSGGGLYNALGTVTLSSPDNVTGNLPDQCGGDPVPLCSG